MKRFLPFLFLAVLSLSVSAQNLVPNPSFESYSNCNGGIPGVNDWMNPDTATPDYYNVCAIGFGVPQNILGNQYPRTGDGYVGMIAYEDAPIFGCPNAIFASGWREYVTVQLTAPLQAGVTYCAQYWVSLADQSRYSSTEHGMYFSTTPVIGLQTARALPFTPQVQNTTGPLADTSGWTKVSGTYTATGGEQYIIIGNFNNDANTSVQCFNTNSFFAMSYYFIDDVFVGVNGTCPGACQLNASIAVSYTGCDAGQAQLAASGVGGSGNYSYQWSTGATSPTLANATPGTYTVTLTDGVGCSGTDTFVVTLPPNPMVTLGQDTFICKGDTLQLSGTTTPSNGLTWFWSNGQTTPSITVNPGTPTVYTAEVSDSNGCTGKDSILVQVGITPAIFIDNSQNEPRCVDEPAFPLTLGIPQGGTYSGPGVSNNQFDPAAAGVGQHWIYYTYSDSVGCSATDSALITINLCTGLAERLDRALIQVYPNPATGQFTLSGLPLSAHQYSIQVYNALGQEVTPQVIKRTGNAVQLALGKVGLHYIAVSGGGERVVLPVSILR